jgi:hypothetical protein
MLFDQSYAQSRLEAAREHWLGAMTKMMMRKTRKMRKKNLHLLHPPRLKI